MLLLFLRDTRMPTIRNETPQEQKTEVKPSAFNCRQHKQGDRTKEAPFISSAIPQMEEALQKIPGSEKPTAQSTTYQRTSQLPQNGLQCAKPQ